MTYIQVFCYEWMDGVQNAAYKAIHNTRGDQNYISKVCLYGLKKHKNKIKLNKKTNKK